jgi:hypothetical protein
MLESDVNIEHDSLTPSTPTTNKSSKLPFSGTVKVVMNQNMKGKNLGVVEAKGRKVLRFHYRSI